MSLVLLTGLGLLPAAPGSVLGELLPALGFLALVAPAWWVAQRAGRDPLRAHGVLVAPRGVLLAALVGAGALGAFLLAVAGLARAEGVAAGPPPWGGAGWRFLHDLVFVALPEEWLFRGVVQPALDRPGGPARRVLGAPLGRGALASAALFGLAHALLERSPVRLLTAGPGLLFAWVRARTGSVPCAAVVHAGSNAALVLALGTWPDLHLPGTG